MGFDRDNAAITRVVLGGRCRRNRCGRVDPKGRKHYKEVKTCCRPVDPEGTPATVVRVVRPSPAGGVRRSVEGGRRRYVHPGRSSASPPCGDPTRSGAPERYCGEVVAFRPPLRGCGHGPHVVLDEGSEGHGGG